MFQWIAAVAASLAAHAGLFMVLWIGTDPEPVAPQSAAKARLDIASYEVDRTSADERSPEASEAEEGEASGASVTGAAVPVSRAESTPIAAGQPLRPADSEVEELQAKVARPAAGQSFDPQMVAAKPAQIETSSQQLRPAGVRASATINLPVSADTVSVVLSAPEEKAVSSVPPTEAPILTASLDNGTRVDASAPAALSVASSGPNAAKVDGRQVVGIASTSRRPAAPAIPRLDPGSETALQQAAAAFASRPPIGSALGDRATAALAWSGSGGAPVDPVSMAAIQAFMRPGDIDASASNAGEVRDDIEALLASVPCARLQTTFVPETGRLELRGHVPEAGVKAPVLSALQAHVGSGIPVADNLLVLPRPQCGALQAIGAVGLPQSTDQLTNPRVVGADAHARIYDFAEGERLEFDLVGADYDAVLYIDYYDADGNVLHLQPNEYLPLEMIEAQGEVVIGADRQGKPSLEIIVAPPFGQEIMVAMATSQPLYEGLRPIMEPAEPYLAFMRERVTEARERDGDFKGEWVYFFVRTAPR